MDSKVMDANTGRELSDNEVTVVLISRFASVGELFTPVLVGAKLDNC